MKKLLSLLTLLLCVCSGAWASGEEFYIKFQKSNSITESPSGYFTYNKGEGTAVSWSSKGKHSCTYGGESYSDVIKMESATQCYFTTTAEATVTIVQTTSNATGDMLRFDGSNLNADLANTTVTVDATNKYNEYVITGVASGKHTITRQKETGLAYVKVVYTGATLTQLSAPDISINSSTGVVTLGAVTNATKITYTTDGADPTAESTEYTVPFTVADGTTVKAIAIGNNENYVNSNISEKVVYLEGVTVATPVITAINGTINITCTTPGAAVQYSTDGTTYANFTNPVTIFATTTVYAKAVRKGATDSDVASQEVEPAPAATAGSSTKILGFVTPGNNNWEYMSADSKNYGIKGKTGTDEEGWSLWISPNGDGIYDKAISGDGSANNTYSIGGTAYQYIKNSNGRQFNIGVPEGYTVNRLTIYGFNNGTPTSTSLWSDVAGTTQTAETEIPLMATAGNAPYVRVFPIGDVTEDISLTNNGAIQQCFILVVDYTTSTCSKPTITVGDFTFADKGYPVTITSNDNLLVSTDGTTYTQQTSPYNTTVTATTTFYAKATATGKDDSEVAEQEVVNNFDSSKKFVAWVYTKGYGAKNYDFATDPMVAALQNDYNVVEVNNATDVAPAEDLANADLIVSTEAMTGNKSLSNGMKAFVGVTPMIGLKAFNYTKGRWSWGTPSNPGSTAQSFAPKSANFKLFDGVEFESDGTVKLATATSGNVIQTVEFGTTDCTAPEGNIILGTLGGDDKKAVMYASKKYFGLGLSSDCWDSYTNNAITIVKNAAAMLINGVGLDVTYEIATISKSISDAGYATLYSQYPLDFSGSGLTAYIATIEGNTVTFESKTSIPALTGVLLKGNAGVHNITVAESTTDVSANKFKGVIADTEVDAGIYVLMNINDVVGFYKTTAESFEVGANTAYLPAIAVPGARAFISLDGEEATGIAEVKGIAAEQQVYDLQGRRVAQPVKGLYIVNGRKVVVK